MLGAFILCAPRSGSTLLRWMLDTHPEVACPPEVSAARVADSLEPLIRYTAGIAIQDEKERARYAMEQARTIVSAQLEAYAKDRKKSVWVEKTPLVTISLADRMRQIFPDARYFCLHRGCLDLANSCIEHSPYGWRLPGLAAYVARTPENVLEGVVRYWCDLTEKELAFEEANKDRCLRVRYEDVVAKPREIAPKLFAHLGLGCPDDLVDRIFSEPHTEGMGDDKIAFRKKIDDGTGRGAALPISTISPMTRNRADMLSTRLGYGKLGTIRQGTTGADPWRAVAELFDKTFPQRLRTSVQLAYGASCKFEVSDGQTTRSWLVDLTGAEIKVVASDAAAQTTVKVAPAVLLELAAGRLNPIVAQEEKRIVIPDDPPMAFRFFRMVFLPPP